LITFIGRPGRSRLIVAMPSASTSKVTAEVEVVMLFSKE
jgi:hypothetical protein